MNDTITNGDCGGRLGESIKITNVNSLVIGCPEDDGKAGSVYYYTQSDAGDQYVFQQTIKPHKEVEEVAADEFGGKLALDENYMAVGTYEVLNGKVYIFTLHDDVWKEVAKIDSPFNDHTYFGYDIKLSGDNILISYWGNIYSYQLNCSDPE